MREVPEPVPGHGEVLVRVEACGVCGSDLNAWRGVQGIEYPLPPGAPGHEVVGTIAALGSGVDDLSVGQRVTGLVWNGLAELTVARAEHLVPVNSLVLGEPLACAMNVLRRARIGQGDRVAIVGFGYLAALVVQLLGREIAGWIAISRRAESRALAMELGAQAAYGFEEVPADAWDSFPVVIEAAGVQQALDFASWLVSFGGRLVVAGYHADGPRTVNMQTWNWKGIDVVNAHERDPLVLVEALRRALPLLRQRHLETQNFISHRWRLDEVAEAFACAEARPGGYVKGVIEP